MITRRVRVLPVPGRLIQRKIAGINDAPIMVGRAATSGLEARPERAVNGAVGMAVSFYRCTPLMPDYVPTGG